MGTGKDTNAIGVNSANNPFSSALVTANADGSLLERQEYAQSLLLSGWLSAVTSEVALPNNTTTNLFTISGGPVKCKIFGLVTTVIGGAANGKLQMTTTTPAATVELNAAAVAITSDAAGTIYRNVGATSVFTPSSGLGYAIVDPVTVEETEFILTPGTVKFHSSATQTGGVTWYMAYQPLSPASRVVAAQ